MYSYVWNIAKIDIVGWWSSALLENIFSSKYDLFEIDLLTSSQRNFFSTVFSQIYVGKAYL